jgi:hypothetical protein
MRTLLLLLALAVAGCGTSSSTNNDGGGGDGGCINATEGDSCNANDVSCSTGGDICCTGFLQCVSGHWVKEYPGCACQTGTFTCGAVTCTLGQFCKKQESGFDGGSPFYSCDNVPSSCTNDQSCACVADAGVCTPTAVASCTDSQGHAVVDCMGQ